ncbi:MAG TPA: DUF3108 domain-containing protein [Rhizomicrobium sp.]|jgi:hypothetical protein|nr:DUF3108 domain-containing protein [Rhizomicrobium sp.]
MLCASPVLLVLLFGGAALAQATSPFASSPAPPAGTIGIAYSIAFWGISFGQTDYEGKFADGGYTANSRFETSGLVSLFWQASINASAAGHIAPQTLAPTQYDSYFRRGNAKNERVRVIFDQNGAETFADPPYDMTKYPVTAAEKREAVDPMSAVTLVLAGIRADHANPCGTVAPVFDGRRRYDIEFAFVKDEPVTLGHLYTGPAHLCRLRYRQIAGFKPKILKEGAAFPPIFAEFADIPAAGAPNGHYVVALKLWARVDWGTVTAQLTELRVPAPATKG